MALDDYIESEVAVAIAATAAVLSPRVRGVLRKGAVYGVAGVLVAGDALGQFARGAARGASAVGATVVGAGGAAASAAGKDATDAGMPAFEEQSIEVEAPIRAAYDQWTQFESFPRFMEAIDEVTQLDDKRTHWRATVGGKTEEWDAEITEQTPDERISWRSTSGAPNGGTVTFDKRGEGRTRVTLRLEYTPRGAVEKTGAALGVVAGRVHGDLERFKGFVEARDGATGAWRGEIHGGAVSDDGGDTAATGAAGAVRPETSGRARRSRPAQTARQESTDE